MLEPFARTDEVRVAGEDIRLPCKADADDRSTFLPFLPTPDDFFSLIPEVL